MQLINSHNIFHRLELDGSTYTAVDSAVQASGPGMLKLRERITGSAWLISAPGETGASTALNDAGPENNVESGLNVAEVPVHRVLGLENKIYIILEGYFGGHTLQDYMDYNDDFNREKARLFSLLFRLNESHPDILPERLHPGHILFTGDELLILPESWSELLQAYDSRPLRENAIEIINYPDADKYLRERCVQYYLASSLMYLLSRSWPLPVENPEILHRYQRRKVIAPAELLLPGATPEFARWYDRAMRMESEGVPAEIRHWLSDMPTRFADTAHRTEEPPHAENVQESPLVKRYRRDLRWEGRRDWIIAHSARVAVVTLVSVIAIAVTITVIQNLTRKLLITGLTPHQVVQTYYESYNSLDSEFMAEATYGSAGRPQVNQVSSLYAIKTVREGNELRQIYMSAPDYLALPADKRPKLTDMMVFGITDLKITELDSGMGKNGTPYADFTASYKLWTPDSGEKTLTSISREDQLKLRQFPRGWKIVALTGQDQQSGK